MNGLSKWTVAVYLAAIFCAGAVSGWVISAKTTKQKMYGPPPKPREVATSWRECLRSKLNLTPDQARKIDAIIEQTSTQMESFHETYVKCNRQATSNRNAQILAVLNPEQRKQFEQFEKERQQAWRSKFKRGDSRRGPRERGASNSEKSNSQQKKQ